MTAPHRTAPHQLLVCLFLILFAPAATAANCASWNANLAVSLATGLESEALHYTWSAVAASCTFPPHAFSFDHYEVCWTQDVAGVTPTAPTAPTGAGVKCKVLSFSSGTTSKDVHVYRSHRTYSSKIFACSNSGCTHWYGDGSTGNSTSNTTVSGTLTEYEHWLLVDVEDYNDSSRVVDDPDAATPTAVFYPDEWTTDHDKLGLWYLGEEGKIWYQETDTTGWVNFVDQGNWDLPATPVAETDTYGTGYGDFYQPADPWVVPAIDDSTPYIRLYLRTGNGYANYIIRSLDSADEKGADFNLECTEGFGCTVATGATCAYGDLCAYDSTSVTTRDEICPAGTTAGTAGCLWVSHAGHGRIGWNDTDLGPVDFASDEPFLLFTGAGRSPYCQGGPDDVYEATWDSAGQEWELGSHYEFYGGSFYLCPDREFTDDHDPYILPLPIGDGFKGYYNDASAVHAPWVCYSDNGSPGSWEACVEIVMGFQDSAPPWDSDPTDNAEGDTEDPNMCVGDTVMFAYQDGATRYEGGFTVPHAPPYTSSCFDDAGIMFIEHQN